MSNAWFIIACTSSAWYFNCQVEVLVTAGWPRGALLGRYTTKGSSALGLQPKNEGRVVRPWAANSAIVLGVSGKV